MFTRRRERAVRQVDSGPAQVLGRGNRLGKFSVGRAVGAIADPYRVERRIGYLLRVGKGNKSENQTKAE